MTEISAQNIRLFRLHAHHLDVRREKQRVPEIVGACGVQNTPPGAWETGLAEEYAAFRQQKLTKIEL